MERKTKLHRKGAGLGGRPPAPGCADGLRRQKAGGYPRDVLLFRRLSIYITVHQSTIFGKRDGRRLQIEHIKTTAIARQ